MRKQTKFIAKRPFGLAKAAVLLFGAFLATASTALASGYEATVLWSARYSAIGGITAGNIEGAEALAYNPAGILKSAPGQDVSANFTVINAQFLGPIGSNNTQETGQDTNVTPFGLLYSATINDQWAFAVGGFTSGGAKAEFDNVLFPNSPANQLAPTVKTNLQINEFSAGVAYRPMTKLRLGAAYRVAIANADFSAVSLPQGNNSLIINPEFSGLTDTEYNAFRLGAMWTDDNWGVGAAYRSEVLFKTTGAASGSVGTPLGVAQLSSSGVQVNTSFPAALNIGGYYDFVPKVWRGYAEYDWTQYSRVDKVGIIGNFTATGLPGTQSFTPLVQNWNDQNTVRIGGEYTGWAMPIRFGYAYSTQVTNTDWARAPFVAPGPSHTVTVGSGLAYLDNALHADGGLDYTTAVGSSFGSADQTPANSDPSVRAGTYAVNAVGAHLGVTYNF